MPLYAGLDVGTTTLSAVILDAETGQPRATCTIPNSAGMRPGTTALGRAELNLNLLRTLAVRALAEAVARTGDSRHEIRGLGVTGQQHGVAFLAGDGEPLRPAITWQDRRVEEPVAQGGESYLHQFLGRAGGTDAFTRMGCVPAAGFMGPTLYWLKHHDQLPGPPATACFIPDAIVSFLSGCPPCTDPTNGGSSGIFDVVARQWAWDLIGRLDLPVAILPKVRDSGDLVGRLDPSLAARTELPVHTAVYVGIGDNQASFLGSVREPGDSILLNVGTGSQVSTMMGAFQRLPGIDTRYFPGGHYLLVGAGLFGGQSYALMRHFFRQIGEAFFGGLGDEDIYDRMTQLAACTLAGSQGLRFSPLFTGTRQDPSLQACLSGIGTDNLTPGCLVRALLEGIAEAFHALFQRMLPAIGNRTQLVGAGNGLRRNRLLAQILAMRFDMPLHIAAREEAATGAALLAAKADGFFESLEEAMASVRYSETLEPSLTSQGARRESFPSS